MNIAPVILFTYNRLYHTQKTISFLQKNEMALQTPLYIYSDGARNDEDAIKVEEVRTYLKTVDGFRSLQVIAREKNMGLAANIIACLPCL